MNLFFHIMYNIEFLAYPVAVVLHIPLPQRLHKAQRRGKQAIKRNTGMGIFFIVLIFHSFFTQNPTEYLIIWKLKGDLTNLVVKWLPYRQGRWLPNEQAKERKDAQNCTIFEIPAV